MVDKNLFLYDLAVVAILKNEGNYLREWLDYHLLAGVEHFYLYDNDSTDNQAEVVKPYVAAGLVDYIPAPGKAMQMPVYNDAVKRFKFYCRYMTFIDGDEFIYPKTNRNIVEVVDGILSKDKNAAGLAINWQVFGSNGQERADYSHGVLERFTRRAPNNWYSRFSSRGVGGNNLVKTIANPLKIKFWSIPHYPIYFEGVYSVNENLNIVSGQSNFPVTADKIAVNHYYAKSREEFNFKQRRGRADTGGGYEDNWFDKYDRNEVFDDGILKYRAARAENFTLESGEDRINRVTEVLTEILSGYSAGKNFGLETALTCRAVSTYLNLKVYEEASISAILNSLKGITIAEAQLLIRDLPNLLKLPYPLVKEIRKVALNILSQFIEVAKMRRDWSRYKELDYINDLLKR